jgi:hypothetical protein
VSRLLTVLALVLGGVAGAAPAYAAPAGGLALPPGAALDLATGEVTTAALPAPLCGSGRICFYDTSIGIRSYFASDTVTGCRDIPASMDNKTSYIVNTSSRSWYVYLTGGCLGNSSYIYARSHGAMNSDWNNNISAFRRN